MGGYTHKGIDLGEIFEPLIPGDPTHPTPVGLVDSSGKDATELYVAVVGGAKIPENISYQQLGVDLRDIFAAKGTVSRFLNPLPWDRTIDENLIIYRQKSRPLVTTMQIKVSVAMDGKVQIVASKPNKHSDPNSVTDTVIYSYAAAPAWKMQYIPANTFFEIRFDVVSNNGSNPSGSILFGTWVAMDGTPSAAEFINKLIYQHDTMVDGAVSKNTNIRISVRRSDLPDNIKTEAVTVMNLNLTVLADLFSNPAPWTANLSAIISNNLPQYPEGETGIYSVSTTYQVNGTGSLVVKRKVTDDAGVGAFTEILNVPWRRALTANDTVPSDFELKFTNGVGVTFNGAPDWVSITDASSHTLTMAHAVPNNMAPGDYVQDSSAALIIRQKSTKGFVAQDNAVSGNLLSSTTIKIGQPTPPDWSGMTLPNLINRRDVDIDYSKPARWEAAGVRYVMGMSTSPTAKNVIGKTFQQTTDNIQNPTEPVIELDKVLTRITPDGWNPSWFEWRYRILSGSVDGASPDVWRTMLDASYNVQVSASVNHGMGAGVYEKFADLAIDVRRITTPGQTFTFTTRLEAGVTLVANGPDWTGMSLGDLSTVQSAVAGIQGSWQASIGLYMASSTDTTGTDNHLNIYTWNFEGVNSPGIELTPWRRLVPAGYSPNDFEWKWELVSATGVGAIAGGPAANIWTDVSENEWFAAVTLADKVVGSHMQAQTYNATVRVTVRHKVQVGWIHTFPDFKMIASIQWQNPPFTLWPREDYQHWAGTYYHTTSVEAGGGVSTTAWQDDLLGVTRGINADWTFTFKTTGEWSWTGNGLASNERIGQWLPQLPGNGAGYSIRAMNITGMTPTSTNITPGVWVKLDVNRYIQLIAARPPAGEPDNNRIYAATIEIRNDSTGQIYQSGPINLTSQSWYS